MSAPVAHFGTCRRLAYAAILTTGFAASAGAVIPPAERVIGAVAEANRRAGRAVMLRISVDAVRAGGQLAARGELLSAPSGHARLELLGKRGVVERHLLTAGGYYSASRNGRLLSSPRPLLPPLALLQISTSEDLAMALRRGAVAADIVALGQVEEHDCYVVGGRTPGTDREAQPLRASFWVDLESLEPVRIDRADGVRYRLGPSARFGKLRLPAWIEIQIGGRTALRLVVRSVTPIELRPGDFAPGWLTRPDQPPPVAEPSEHPAPSPG